jgi:hypothetical protein
MASKPMTAERLAEQKEVVEKAASSKMLNKYASVMISGDNAKIIKAQTGELKNTHNAVFKKCLGKTCCEHCGAEERLDRAHMTSRPSIAKKVLDEIHPDPDVPIDLKVFMTAFVMEHANIGVWMLCRKCHKELG